MIAVLKPFGKALYYATYPILRFIGLNFSTKRVRVQVLSDTGSILLVKTWFGRQLWSLPGGGIEKGESPEQAAVRELAEETAIQASVDQLELLGEWKATDGIAFDLIVYRLRIKEEVLAPLPPGRNLEIIERAWYPTTSFPKDTSPAVSWSLDINH